MTDPLLSDLERDEGLRLKPYHDTVGKLTIGIGRNLDDVGISEAEARAMLAADVARTDAALRVKLPWVFDLDPVRASVVRNLAFNMGVAALLTFTRTLGALQAHDYATAATMLLQSRYAQQVGARAQRLADMLRTGVRPTPQGS